MTPYKLNNQNLPAISGQITKPTYHRQNVKAGIIHVGIGGFHRAHQAYYTDQLLHDESILDWGICGIGLLDYDQKIYDVLKAQDGLYTLIVKEFDGSLSKTIIGSIVEYLFAQTDPVAAINKMADPDIKIITLTITEGGYNYLKVTDQFDQNNPLIQHDLQNPKSPKTIFGYLHQALSIRRDKGLKGCTIQSCDNIQGNGHLTKRMLLSYVQLAQPDLEEWIESHVSFPNSMVDRITPATHPQDIAELRESNGIDDLWPVVCEPFKQWIIEDDFIEGRPEWERHGVQFVKDVEPYELMKLGLLNAGHSVLGLIGALMGYKTIEQSVNNSAIRLFLQNFMDHEVTPTLGTVGGINLDNYKASLIQRFGNQNIKDQVDRICSESSAKIPIFILPTITKQLKTQGSIDHAALVIAAWAVYSLGVDEDRQPLRIKDQMQNILNEKALAAIKHPDSFLEIDDIFGDLSLSKTFVSSYTSAYRSIVENGVENTVTSMNAMT